MISLNGRMWMPSWGVPIWNVASTVAMIYEGGNFDALLVVGLIALVIGYLKERSERKELEHELRVRKWQEREEDAWHRQQAASRAGNR